MFPVQELCNPVSVKRRTVWEKCIRVWEKWIQVWENCIWVWEKCIQVWEKCIRVWEKFILVWEKCIGDIPITDALETLPEFTSMPSMVPNWGWQWDRNAFSVIFHIQPRFQAVVRTQPRTQGRISAHSHTPTPHTPHPAHHTTPHTHPTLENVGASSLWGVVVSGDKTLGTRLVRSYWSKYWRFSVIDSCTFSL